MHIYIDANLLVKFLETDSESLKELEKLIAVKRAGATLWLPEQTKREFWRNRENNVKKLLGDFEQRRALGNPPLLVREHPEFQSLVEAAGKVDEQRRAIAATVKAEVDSQETYADKVIRKLFEASTSVDTDDNAIFMKAHRRALCHLPPGKGEDLGDRLNWVALITALPKGAELHIISDDTDFRNEGFSDDIRPYLKWEWKKKKNGDVTLWSRISQFLVAKFPQATNAAEMEKGILAQRLKGSNTFGETHDVIAQLSKLDGFTDEHCRYIAEAMTDNSQVRNISDDADVKAFYDKFMEKYGSRLDEGLRVLVEALR